jgi:hypothetical protein
MNEQDRKKKKMPDAPIRAPQGNVKGIGKMGQYTGGLSPLVVAPQPGLAPRRVAPAIFSSYGTDGRGKSGGKK